MYRDKIQEEIKKWPCIYDKTCASNKDKRMKKAAWEHVASAISGQKVWSEMSIHQKQAKVKSLKSKWQGINRKQKQIAEASGISTINKKGNILDFFNKTEYKTANKCDDNDNNEEPKIRDEDIEYGNNREAEDENRKKDIDEIEDGNDDRKALLSLLPNYKLLRSEDRIQLNKKILQWITETVDSYSDNVIDST